MQQEPCKSKTMYLALDEGGEDKEMDCELEAGHQSQHRLGEIEWED